MTGRWTALLLAAVLAFFTLAAPASAALSEVYPETEPSTISIPQEQIDALDALLETVEPDDSGCFEIIDALSGDEEIRSTDYSVESLNVRNGVAYLSEEDGQILDEAIAQAGLAEASDAEKIAWAVEWIHNNLVYDGYHTGSYVYSCFVEAGGQCNIYNGAICALAIHLGYHAQLVRGYRGSTGSQTAHWWTELITESGDRLVLETGNTVDGNWYFLGNSYGDTHTGGRDYIKCNRYAYNGEPFEYLGAAVNPMGPVQDEEGVELWASVWKGADYNVARVGLLFGESPDALTELTSETVDAVYNAANESRGFSMSYRPGQLGADLENGKTYYYAFFAELEDGVRCTGDTYSFVAEGEQTPQAVPAVGTVQQKDNGGWVTWVALAAAAASLAVLIVSARRQMSMRRRRRRRRAVKSEQMTYRRETPKR